MLSLDGDAVNLRQMPQCIGVDLASEEIWMARQ